MTNGMICLFYMGIPLTSSDLGYWAMDYPTIYHIIILGLMSVLRDLFGGDQYVILTVLCQCIGTFLVVLSV